jgi:hypothetical protein
MAMTKEAMKAFREKGYAVNSKIDKKDRRKAITLKHAVFSGYAVLDNLTSTIRDFIERGCIVQAGTLKGYLFFSYPENEPEAFNEFRHELIETGNHLRFVGYSDRLFLGI